MAKRVRITLEMDASFLRLLNTNCQLSGLGNLRENYKQHDPSQVLAVVAMLEARGATEEQIHAETPIEWREGLQAIHSERKVYSDTTDAFKKGDRVRYIGAFNAEPIKGVVSSTNEKYVFVKFDNAEHGMMTTGDEDFTAQSVKPQELQIIPKELS